MRVGDRKVLDNGWSVTAEPDPYGRDDLCSIVVRWDLPMDTLPEVVYRQTVGLKRHSDITQDYWEATCKEFDDLDEVETNELIEAHLQKVQARAEKDERQRLLRLRRREAARQARREEGERRRAEYAYSIRNGQLMRAKWILNNARHPRFWQRYRLAYPKRAEAMEETS